MFISGATLGWMLEVVYRRYFGKAKKWINPGFLSGPYLPLYGTGVCLLYIISDLNILFGIKILLFALVTTSIEYLTGLFFLKVYNTRLWDYSKLKFNIRGIISPLYTLYWTLLSLVFYYVLYPYFFQQVSILYEHLEFSLFVGVFYGIILMDIIQSFNVLNKLKAMSDALGQTQMAIHYEQLKIDIAERYDELADRVEDIGDRLEGFGGRVTSYRPKLHRPTFLHPFSGDYNLRRHMQKHFDLLKKRERNELNHR